MNRVLTGFVYARASDTVLQQSCNLSERLNSRPSWLIMLPRDQQEVGVKLERVRALADKDVRAQCEMANVALRLPENVPGDFFVDSTCIDCDACRQIAPETFSQDTDVSIVHHQPENEIMRTHLERCIEWMKTR